MRIRKYDFNYSRRAFMEKVAKGTGAAGVLTSLWPLASHSADNITKAYPDELLSIEMYTKGKIKPGDTLTASNVDVVKDLLDEITYRQVKDMGRKIGIVASTTDMTKLFNHTYLEKTLANRGRAKLGPDGNVWTDGQVGNPWIGGMPFTEPKDGNEAQADITLNWGRNDYSQYPVLVKSLGPDGSESYRHEFLWCELNTTSRNDGKVFMEMRDRLRLQSVFFTSPNDAKGSSFLNIWSYDQRKFPDLYGYFPAFKRVRQFPTNQRFEPLVPGMTFFLSDAWSAGDPMLTWGNSTIIERKPHLAAMGSKNWTGGTDPNWERPRHGGPKGQTFMESYYELVPEVLVVEAAPTGYPRAPVGKKRAFLDARNLMPCSTITYDRRGQVWKQFEASFCQYKNEKAVVLGLDGKPNWSWTYVHSHDIQSNRMSLLMHARSITGGYVDQCHTSGIDVYNKFLTTSAIARLGQ